MKFTNKTYKVHKQRIILPNYDELNKTIKIYNADLNASYNIASRFIYQEMNKIKENLKLKKNEYQQFETKVLELFCRASFCLSDVRKSNKILKNFVLI